MKIIVLTGKPNSGKTTTFEMLYDLLTKNMKNKPKINKIPNTPKKDFQCILTYKKKKVAIFSAGDNLFLICSAIFIYSEFDYIIVAHSQSPSGKDKGRIIELTKANKHQTLIVKTECKKGSSQKVIDKANAKDCKKIIKAIK